MKEVLNFLENSFDMATNWYFDGHKPLATFCRMLATVGGLTAAHMTYLKIKENRDAQRIFSYLDKNPSICVTSVADGIKNGLSPKQSEAAEQLAYIRAVDEDVIYYSEEKVKENHLLYKPLDWSAEKGRQYVPVIVAWQVARSQPEIAVPLYSGPKEGLVVRGDGAILNIASYSYETKMILTPLKVLLPIKSPHKAGFSRIIRTLLA